MKNLGKKLTLVLTVGIMMMVFAGCSKANKDEFVGFYFEVESNKGFDYVIIKINGEESKLEPMHDDKEVISGYSLKVNIEGNADIEVEAVKNGEVLLNKDASVDLTNGKTATIKLVDTKDGGIDLIIKN